MYIVPVNKTNRVMSLPLNAPPLMRDVVRKEVVAESICWIGVNLSFTGRNAYEILGEFHEVCVLGYEMSFQRLLKAV